MISAFDRLRLRFTDSLKEAGASIPADAADALFRELVDRYGEAHRRYHTLDHVDACLAWLDWGTGLALRPAEVSLALWFHDVIYEPRANDNEERSAAFARSRLAGTGISVEVLDRVEAHILATRAHEAEHPDSCLVVDIDLAILGSLPGSFDEFERAIRLEYEHVPDALFQAGRREVLAGFLKRPSIFQHRPFREQLEMRARANIQRRIAELSTA